MGNEAAIRASVSSRVTGSAPERWRRATGCAVRSGSLGLGTIVAVDITRTGDDPISLQISFEQDPNGRASRTFRLGALLNPAWFPERSGFPADLENEILRALKEIADEQQRQEREAKLAELRRKEQAAREEQRRHEETIAREQARSIVASATAKVDRAEQLGALEVEALAASRAHPHLARYYCQEYERRGDPWLLIRASAAWRAAGRPHEALDATNPLRRIQAALDVPARAAMLTTRGAAFRDLGKLDFAEQCARAAIQCDSSSHHAYGLLGAVCISKGLIGEADACFAQIEKLGGHVAGHRQEISRALSALDDQARAQALRALRTLNSNRYNWL